MFSLLCLWKREKTGRRRERGKNDAKRGKKDGKRGKKRREKEEKGDVGQFLKLTNTQILAS